MVFVIGGSAILLTGLLRLWYVQTRETPPNEVVKYDKFSLPAVFLGMLLIIVGMALLFGLIGNSN